ncbi:MAG TPA: hypothetical protein VJ343_02130 [archaeon]|nr:hypothetical protein [archaeon]
MLDIISTIFTMMIFLILPLIFIYAISHTFVWFYRKLRKINTTIAKIYAIALSSFLIVVLTLLYYASATPHCPGVVHMVSLVDASCDGNAGTLYVTVKNMDPYREPLPINDLLVKVDSAPVNCTWALVGGGPCAQISPNGSCVCTTPTGGATGTSHKVRVIGPVDAEEKEVYC